MSTTIGTIELLAKIDTSQYKRGAKEIEKANQDLEGSGEKSSSKMNSAFMAVPKIGLAAIAAAVVSVGALIIKNFDSAIQRVDTLNNSARTFENMGFNSKDVKNAMSALEQSIRGLPTPLDQAVKGVQLLSGATNDVGKAQQIFTALNNAIIGFGGSAEDVQGAIVQVSQAFSNGKVDAQTWNSLIQNGLGPVLNTLARQMGITTGQLKDGLSEGTISVQTFQDALIKLNKEGGGGMKSLEQISKDATSGIGTGWQNLNTAVTRGIASIVETIGTAKISEALSGIGTSLEGGLKKAGEALNWYIKRWGAFFEALKPVIEYFNQNILPILNKLWTIFVEQLKPSLDSLKESWNSIYEATKPYHEQMKQIAFVLGGLVLAGIVAVGIAIGVLILVIAKIVEWTVDFVEWFIKAGIAMDNFRKSVADGVGSVLKSITGLPGAVSKALGNLTSVAYDAGRDLINGLLRGIGDSIGRLMSAIGNLASNIAGTFKKALGIQSPSKVFMGFGENIVQGLASGVDKYSSLASNAISDLSGEVSVSGNANFSQLDKQGSSSMGGNTYHITANLSGVMATSASAVRETGKMFIRSVNEELAAQQEPLIGNGAI